MHQFPVKPQTLLKLQSRSTSDCGGWRGFLGHATCFVAGFGVVYFLSKKKVDLAVCGKRCFYALRKFFPRGKDNTIRSITGYNKEVCPVCLGSPEPGVRASCGHLLCASCLVRYCAIRRSKTPPCPLCRAPLTTVTVTTDLKNLIPENPGAIDDVYYNVRMDGGDVEFTPTSFGSPLYEENYFFGSLIAWGFVVLTLVAAKLQVIPSYDWIVCGSILDFLVPLAVMPAIYVWCTYRQSMAIRYE